MPQPRAWTPPCPPALRVVFPNTSFTPWLSSQDRAPQPYLDSSKHTGRNQTSASSRLGDSDGRQRSRHFCDSRKGIQGRNERRARPGHGRAPRERALGPRPISVHPSGSGPGGRRWRAHPSKVGRKGHEERPQPALGVYVSGSGTWTQPGAPSPRGGRASRVPVRRASGNTTVGGAGEGAGGGSGRAPGLPGVGGWCRLGAGLRASPSRPRPRPWSLPPLPPTPPFPPPHAGPSSASLIFSRPQAKRSGDLRPKASRLRKKAAD